MPTTMWSLVRVMLHFITHMYMKLYMLDATYAAVYPWSLTFMDKISNNLHCITLFPCSKHTISFTECLAHNTYITLYCSIQGLVVAHWPHSSIQGLVAAHWPPVVPHI